MWMGLKNSLESVWNVIPMDKETLVGVRSIPNWMNNCADKVIGRKTEKITNQQRRYI